MAAHLIWTSCAQDILCHFPITSHSKYNLVLITIAAVTKVTLHLHSGFVSRWPKVIELKSMVPLASCDTQLVETSFATSVSSLTSVSLGFVLSLAEGQANPKVQARRAGLLGRAVLRTAILSKFFGYEAPKGPNLPGPSDQAQSMALRAMRLQLANQAEGLMASLVSHMALWAMCS